MKAGPVVARVVCDACGSVQLAAIRRVPAGFVYEARRDRYKLLAERAQLRQVRGEKPYRSDALVLAGLAAPFGFVAEGREPPPAAFSVRIQLDTSAPIPNRATWAWCSTHGVAEISYGEILRAGSAGEPRHPETIRAHVAQRL